MNEELLEISRQLQELARRLETIAAAQACVPESPEEEEVPEAQVIPAPAEAEVEAAPVIEEAEPVAEEAEPSSVPSAETVEIRFTLNDRYRFLRELFGGSAERMNAVVAEAALLHSAEQTAAYLTDSIGWDLEAPTEHDFYLAVTAHFNPRPTLLS